ncbi:MAG: glycosyltransferase, partial [Patescibacteria group bacterium]
MKIALIVRKLNLKGGTQRQALSLARELKNKGHEVVICGIYYSKEGCYPELLDGFRVVSLPTQNMSRGTLAKTLTKFAPIAETVRDNREALALAKLMDDDFELLNPHDQVSYKVAHFYKKIKRNIPAVWNMNDLPQKVYGFDRARGCDDNFKQAWWRHLAYRIFDWYENSFFLSSMDEIVVVDFFNRDLVLKYLGREAFTVRSGPDFEHFSYKDRTHPKDEIKLLSSGILMPHRRYEDSIKALLLLRVRAIPAKLTIMGDIENDKKYHAKLVHLIEELGLQDSVTFTGRVSE